MSRILIVTASFGDGHNTAARNIREALEKEVPGAQVRVVDLYAVTNPRINTAMKAGYRIAITRATRLWSAIFRLLDKPGVLERSLPLIAKMRKNFEKLAAEFQPAVIVSTYPLYSFLAAEIGKHGRPLNIPLVTVVTDSTEINTAWFRCQSDAFVVADSATADRLTEGGVPPDKIHPLGFPVDLRFEEVTPLSTSVGAPWKILFMPSTRRLSAVRTAKSLLARKDIELTVLTGRSELMRGVFRKHGLEGDRCRLVGWTDQMPNLLAEHHAFLGKAGGAITQEAIAAGCPILIHHVVPGQEEGNIALLLQHQMGALANTPELLRMQVESAFGGDALVWKRWKRNLAAMRNPSSARAIARFIERVAQEGVTSP